MPLLKNIVTLFANVMGVIAVAFVYVYLLYVIIL
jgi:hypothetical protein